VYGQGVSTTPDLSKPNGRGLGGPGYHSVSPTHTFFGTAKNLSGKAQEGFGRVTGDTKTQVEDVINQAAGATQDLYGQAKESVSDAAEVVPRIPTPIATARVTRGRCSTSWKRRRSASLLSLAASVPIFAASLVSRRRSRLSVEAQR
jgi:uncharacterized protein YjbJ (UPF0337 family)